jgi:hypothetical protein
MSIYDPASYPQGVPNPYGIMVHAWKGGPLNEGTRYHGPVYTRPVYSLPWEPRPLWGVGADADDEWGSDEVGISQQIKKMERGALIKGVLVGSAITLVAVAIYKAGKKAR